MRMKASILIFSLLFSFLWINGQSYSDFIGAGHDSGISVQTSHNDNNANNGNKTIDGFAVTNQILLADASRFLAQSTIGYDYEMIQMAAAMGYEAWLDEQFSLPRQRKTQRKTVARATTSLDHMRTTKSVELTPRTPR